METFSYYTTRALSVTKRLKTNKNELLSGTSSNHVQNKNRMKQLKRLPLGVWQLAFCLILGSTSIFAQNPAFQVTSTTGGFVAPSMTASQRGLINTPVAGSLVYQTDAPIGYYFYNGTAWVQLTSSTGTVTSVAALTLGTTGTDLSSTVATGTTTPVITLNVPTASATNRGALSSADWTSFNNKVGGSGTNTQAAYWNASNTLTSNAAVTIQPNSTTTTLGSLAVTSNSATANTQAVYGSATGAALVYGVTGTVSSTSADASGVKGIASALTGETNGVWGTNASATDAASGVYGTATSSTGNVNGVFGVTFSTNPNSSGVRGETSVGNGVLGLASGNGGYGVYGANISTGAGSQIGVYGEKSGATSSGTGYGVYGTAIGSGTTNAGGFFTASGATNNFAGIFQGNLLLSNVGTASELRLAEPSASGTNYIAFKAQAQAANVTYTLPGADGTSGQVLSTNGTGTLSWATAAGGGSGVLLNIQVLTSGTSYTPTTGTTCARIILIGGGGGGGGALALGSLSFSGAVWGASGGSGGYVEAFLTGVGAGPYTCSVGAAGTAGTAGVVATPTNAGNGVAGGNTSLTFGATTYTANGGSGGVGVSYRSSTAPNTSLNGGAGGATTNGLISLTGQQGGSGGIQGGAGNGVSSGYYGCGGSNPYGFGGQVGAPATGNTANGRPGTGYGAGGGGGAVHINSGTGRTQAGGQGSAGVIIIYEYK
jgi:hypothetical protein